VNEPRCERRGNVEVRLHADGTLDELLVYDPADPARVLFHLEQMSEVCFWMRAEGDATAPALAVNIFASTGARPAWNAAIGGDRGDIGPVLSARHEWDE
jgi:hypothetical protein